MAEQAAEKLKTVYKDIERLIVEDEQEIVDVIDARTQKAIINQVNEEYNVCYPHTEAKRAVMLSRLRLYNNQRRDADAVGDPLMYTVFNTIHAALYDDRLMATWEGRGGKGDEDVEENLNVLSEFDYGVMGKDEIDYFWNWDAEFFGRGLLLMMDFDRTKGIMAPLPELIDPTAFIRDPRASSVNGDRKARGAMRFGGYESGAGYYDLKASPGYFNLGALKKDTEIRSLSGQAQEERNTAQGRENFPQREEALSKYNNYEFKLINWFTTIKGERYLVTTANQRSQIVRLVKLKYGKLWPIIDRAFSPTAHDWDGVSVPDITEDKQRARAVLLNLGLKSAKSEAMPQYLFDKTRIKNKNELNFRSNKFIGVDGSVDNAIAPMSKSTVHQYVNIIMDMLDQSAQRATATSEMQMGVSPDKERTLGELQLVSGKADTRYSMSAKVYGWSERAFWRQWYRQYKIHFKDGIDEKIVRIQGAMAPLWRPLDRDNIISQVDPDVKIESRVISEGKRMRTLQSFTAFAQLAIQNPENNRREIEKKLARLNGLRKEEIDMIFPQTVDELQAEDENVLLNVGKVPPISVMDDHKAHVSIHSKAVQNAQTMAHIRAHKKLMLIKRDRQDIFPPKEMTPLAMQNQGAGGLSAKPTPYATA